MGFQGFNCTIPHKVKVIEYLDGAGHSASLMGAVNCVSAAMGNGSGKTLTEKALSLPCMNSPTPIGKKW